MAYTTIANLRDEGVPNTYADEVLTKRIARVEKMIDAWTGRHFEPVAKTIRVNGAGGRAIFLNEPICDVSEIRVVYGDPFDSDFETISIDDVIVFNRHLTQGLTDPDDRDNPQLAFRYDREAGLTFELGHWPEGRQNIEIEGVFGYTEPDPDGVEVNGITPVLITHLANLMVIRDLPNAFDVEDRDDLYNRGRVVRMKTRDQEIGYAAPSGAQVGAYTGDPEVDNLIALFRRPARMAAV